MGKEGNIKGEQGEPGKDGTDGQDGADGKDGVDGEDGKDGANGTNGQDGKDGVDGKTPYIGENGNWWIGDTDTGIVVDLDADDRGPLTDGLTFDYRIINNVAGLVVTGYTGSSKDVIIPNYIGSTPVIGIATGNSSSGFFQNALIESVSLSKNTIYLGENAFNGCTSLKKVDFNGAKLTSIPEYCFYGCSSLSELTLPETVTRLEAYSLVAPFLSINLENVTYFGQYCLRNYQIPYFYLSNKVEYYNCSFPEGTMIYLEAETLPENWIVGDSLIAVYNCKQNSEYIYKDTENGIILYRVKNRYEILDVPSQINGKNVVEIGHGFNSNLNYGTDSGEYLDSVSDLYLSDYIFFPNTIKKIGSYTCWTGRLRFVYVPSSVEYIAETLLGYKNRIVFESSNYCKIYCRDGLIVEENCADGNLVLTADSSYLFNLGISKDDIVIDLENKMILCSDTTGYNLLSYMTDTNETTIEIPSTYNGKTIHTILRGAINIDSETYTLLKINANIQRIRTKGITVYNCYVYLGETISIINENGIYCNNTNCGIYIESAVKPIDWDSSFTNLTSSKIYYNQGDLSNSYLSDDYLYLKDTSSIHLLKYVGTSSTIKVPRSIEDLEVTTIKAGFYNTSNSTTPYIYIPSNVVTIEENAFVNSSSYYFYFYLETSTIPEGWHENYYYNSRYSNNSSYKSVSYNRTFNY